MKHVERWGYGLANKLPLFSLSLWLHRKGSPLCILQKWLNGFGIGVFVFTFSFFSHFGTRFLAWQLWDPTSVCLSPQLGKQLLKHPLCHTLALLVTPGLFLLLMTGQNRAISKNSIIFIKQSIGTHASVGISALFFANRIYEISL